MADKGTAGTRSGLDAGFSVSPELATEAFRHLSQLQDVIGDMVRQAKVLGRTVPLGGGYAEEVGMFMARYGVGRAGSAVESLTDFGKEIEELKNRIRKALHRYESQDDAAKRGVDASGG
jgi:hypothetical protein